MSTSRATVTTYSLTSTATTPAAPSVAGPQYTFLLRPGVPPINGVFSTWASLMQAVAQVPGPKFIAYDDTVAACEVTAGNWNVDDCTISSVSSTGAPGLLSIDVGAVLSYNNLAFLNARLFVHATTAVSTYIGGSAATLRLDATTIDCLAAGPFMHLTPSSGTCLVIMTTFSRIGDGTHPVVTVDAGATVNFFVMTASSLFSHGTSGTGTATVTFDPTAFIGAGQAATFNEFPLSDARSIPYTPTSLGSWSGVSPQNLQVALDRIATKIGPIP